MPGRSRGPASDADECGEERYGLAALDREPAAKIIPEADVQLGACLDQPEESIAAVASKVARVPPLTLRLVTWQRMSFSEPLVCSAISGRLSAISSSAL